MGSLCINKKFFISKFFGVESCGIESCGIQSCGVESLLPMPVNVLFTKSLI